MTLREMSAQYREDAAVFAGRIRALQQQSQRERDPARRAALERRAEELGPLLRQSRAMANLTAHYYERGGRRCEKHPL